MSSQTEINNAASMVVSAKTAITNKNNNYQKAAGLKCFKGDVADSLKIANSRVKNKVNTFINAYGTLNSRLISLDSAAKRAETSKQSGRNNQCF